MADVAKIDGVTIKMGGQEWIVPALSLGQVKRLTPQINAMNTSGDDLTEAGMDGAIAIVHAALSRNYPDVTVEKVADMIDLANMRATINAVMGISGLISSGEAKPGASQ